jgi:tetratricopeptide (TPR) repeat protein/tRNA A-37 threonylcarbamoyl transferase component Bud32
MTCAELIDRLRHLGAPPHVLTEAVTLATSAPDGAALAAALVARGLVRPDVAQAALTPAGPTLRRGASERRSAAAAPVGDARTLARGAAAGRAQQVGSSSGERTLPRGTSERAQPPALTETTTSPGSPALAPAPTSTGLAGRYELTDAIGSGGEAVVYAAKDLTLDREVAIKLVRPDHAHDPATAQDLRAEARATGRLEHPGVVPVHEVGLDPQRGAFLAMKLVRGRTLTQEIEAAHARVRRGEAAQAAEERRLLEAVLKVCDTLAYVHSRGVLHRDLKAENVMVGEFGEVHVMDFGLARAQNATATSSAGELQGTPRCMAPEQAAGRVDLDERVDVYAVGALLFHVVAGATPFARLPDLDAVLAAVRAGRAGRPSRAPGAWSVAPALEAIVLRAMARNREARYAKVADLAADLRAYLAGERVSAHREGVAERLAREARRRPRLVVGSTVAVVCLGLGGLALVRAQGQAALREATARQEAADGARSTLADAARAEARAALTRLTGGGDDTGVRTGLALTAVQAAQRWHDLTTGPARTEAARALFDAANALGEVALATSQWDLAERAFALEVGLGVDEARATADVARAGESRTSEARRRRAEIEGWLAQVTSGELANRPDGLTDAVFAIVRYPEAQTVEILASSLAAVTTALLAAEHEFYLAAASPDADEARAGGQPIQDLDAALELRATGTTWGALPDNARTAIGQAGERMAQRSYRALSADARRAAPGPRQLLAQRQRDALGPGNLALARVCCDALGRVADATTRDRAVLALAAYLDVEADELRAVVAALALCRIGGEDAIELVHLARVTRFGVDSAFATQVKRGLANVKSATSRVPASAAEFLARGERLAAQGDLVEAIANYDRALMLVPEAKVHVLRLRGFALSSLGRTKDALADFDQVLVLEPSDAETYANRGVARYALRDLRGALEDHDRALELGLQNARTYTQRGLVRADLGDLQGALTDHDEALDLDPLLAAASMNRGITLLRMGDPRRAIADFDRALELDPRWAAAFVNRGNARAAVGDRQGAIADFDHAIELDPHHVTALNNRGNERQALGDFLGAIKDLDRALAVEPDVANAYVNRGVARMALGDRQGAIADYDRALELDPRLVAAVLNRANARAALGDRPGAAEDYDRTIELDPGSARAFAGRGLLRFVGGDLRGAIVEFDRAIELDPNLAMAYSGRGTAQYARGDLQSAVADCSRAIELDPRSLEAFVIRGGARRDLGLLKDAIADYDRALKLNPYDGKTYVSRGAVRLQLDDPQGALADFDRSLEVDPGSADAHAKRGEVRHGRGDLEGAVADYDRALELEPLDAATCANRGVARGQLGDLRGGLADLDRAIELAPEVATAYTNRGLLREDLEDPRGAIADHDRAIGLDPGLAIAYMNRGNVLLRQRDLRRALGDFDRAIELAPEVARFYAGRARARHGLKDVRGTLTDLDRALELDPGLLDAYVNRGRIRQTAGDHLGAVSDFKRVLELAPDHPLAAALHEEIQRLRGTRER